MAAAIGGASPERITQFTVVLGGASACRSRQVRLLRPRPAKLRCSSWHLIGQLASGDRSVPPVGYDQAAIIFSLASGVASRKVCIGVLPKHHRPWCGLSSL